MTLGVTRVITTFASLLVLVACKPSTAPAPAPVPADAAPASGERWSAAVSGGPVALAMTDSLVLVASDGMRALSLDGEVVDPPSLDGVTAPVAVDADYGTIWVAESGRVHRLEAGKVTTVALPDGAAASSIAASYGDTAFVGDAEAGKIYVVSGDTAEVFAEADPRTLVLSGGSLFAGGERDLVSIALATAEVKPVAENVGPFEGLTLDHLGYFAAAVSDRGLVRITPQGEVTDLAPGPTGPLAFDSAARSLLVVDRAAPRVVALDYLGLTGEDPALWAERDDRPMRPFELNGIILAGAEYWPYRGNKKPDYPADVLWGFYPEKDVVFEGDKSPAAATPEAIECAERSYAALRTWAASPPKAFHQAVNQGRSSRFYLWINDYSKANTPWPHDIRPNKFWYWQRNPTVRGRVPGYWKWETTLTPEGKCLIPALDQIETYLADPTP